MGRRPKVSREEVLRPLADPFGPEGGIAVLRGNLAPGGAVVKYFSVPDEMHVHVGPARVFDLEDAAVEALLARQVRPVDVVVIRYEGPRANGMPVMDFATTIIVFLIHILRCRRAILSRSMSPPSH